MMQRIIEAGEEVAVIRNTHDGTHECFFLGYGVYEGKFLPEGNISRKGKMLLERGKECCRIKLDDGNTVYDYECWFMSKERFMKVFLEDEYKEGWKVINIDMEGKRRKE